MVLVPRGRLGNGAAIQHRCDDPAMDNKVCNGANGSGPQYYGGNFSHVLLRSNAKRYGQAGCPLSVLTQMRYKRVEVFNEAHGKLWVDSQVFCHASWDFDGLLAQIAAGGG